MKRTLPPVLICFVISLLLSIPSNAQVKKGFKHFRKKRIEKAEAKFNKSIARRPLERPVSELGLFLMRQREVFHPASSYRDMETTFLEVSEMKLAFDSLPDSKKAWFKKKKHIQVSEGDYNILLARAQRQALERVRAADSLLLLDTLAHYMFPAQ